MRFYITDNRLFDIKLDDKYCLFSGDSATGKTYMTSLIEKYCLVENIPCYSFNYRHNEDILMNMSKLINDDSSITIIDNSDLILTKKSEIALLTRPGIKIIINHSYENIDLLPMLCPGLYSIYCDENKMLKTRRIGEL